MKNLILAIFAFISVSAYAQKDTAGLKIPISNGSVVYEHVFETPGKTKAQLYNDAQQWFITRYKNFRDIEVADSANDRVIGKGKEIVAFLGPFKTSIPFQSRMSIQIDCKDGKFRSRISAITLSPRDTGTAMNFTTSPEELLSDLTENRRTSGLTKAQMRQLLQNLNTAIDITMASLNKALMARDDF